MGRKYKLDEEIKLELLISTLAFNGQQYPSLEVAIEKMPAEFWSKLNEEQRDEVERRLKRYFEEEA